MFIISTQEEFKSMSVAERQDKYNKKGSGLSNKLRGLVSKKKLRFQKDGFDLDLTYITERVIAMGFPSSGTEALYRNKLKDVQKFFEKYHQDHYKVYNLCAERAYKETVFTKHGGVVKRFPFQDHNPSPFEVIPALVQDVMQFLVRKRTCRCRVLCVDLCYACLSCVSVSLFFFFCLSICLSAPHSSLTPYLSITGS